MRSIRNTLRSQMASSGRIRSRESASTTNLKPEESVEVRKNWNESEKRTGKRCFILMTEYKLVKGRPESDEGRLAKEIRCYDCLDRLGMEYWRTDHPDAQAYTMEACKEIDAVLGATVCKNLFLTNRQHTQFYLLMMRVRRFSRRKNFHPRLDPHVFPSEHRKRWRNSSTALPVRRVCWD